jgi:hypothetical protein
MSDLLDLALDGHGGLELWEKLESVSATITVSGALFGLKGYPDGLGTTEVRADVSTPRVGFAPFLGHARGAFEPDRVVVSAEDGSERHLDDPRAECLSLAPDEPWEDLHLLYFAGYAMWNYLTTPYLLTRDGIEVREGGAWAENGEPWRRLEAAFPPGVDTHSRRQTFYFDAQGRLRRHDYVADVIGGWARVAHYCADHVQAGGLVFPTRRWVRPIRPGNRSLPFPTMVWLELTDLHVETR